jgi:hypothetical protein
MEMAKPIDTPTSCAALAISRASSASGVSPMGRVRCTMIEVTPPRSERPNEAAAAV